ncbi:hypothetical protein N305_11245, partial [Manacus vitellinus]
FLLLSHGRGCQEFESMCCLNISDHSESIYRQIATLQEETKKITRETGFFDLEGWLSS